MEITKYGLARYEDYPHGRAYDNLFNAEHRDIMVERYAGTSAASITIEDLLSVS